MMFNKKLLIYIVLINFSFVIAQPIPDCAKNTVNKKLFLKSNNNLLGYPLSKSNPSIINQNIECFSLQNKVKDSLGLYYYKINVYKKINDFSNDFWTRRRLTIYNNDDARKRKKVSKMEIYLINFTNKDSFNLYLDIPKFKKGNYIIDVSKKSKTKKVSCQMCKDSINAIDVSPNDWCEMKN